jgi:ornithine cyclodeaminase
MVTLIGPERLRELTPWDQLIDALRCAFREPCHLPERLHFDISGAGSLLVMPAWIQNGLLGVKVVQAFPGNSIIGKPTVHGVYMLASAIDGEVYSLIDAQELTARRTAATSALASTFLSRDASRCLLVMGAELLASRVSDTLGLHAEPVESLEHALSRADIISTVTGALDPILPGRSLRPGTHIDLIGGFTPLMREADDDVMRSANIYVDMLSSALREAGDITIPLERGVIDRSDIRGDLFDLCTGRIAKRNSDDAITVFKSLGIALEDLAAAVLGTLCRHRCPPPQTRSAVRRNHRGARRPSHSRLRVVVRICIPLLSKANPSASTIGVCWITDPCGSSCICTVALAHCVTDRFGRFKTPNDPCTAGTLRYCLLDVADPRSIASQRCCRTSVQK